MNPMPRHHYFLPMFCCMSATMAFAAPIAQWQAAKQQAALAFEAGQCGSAWKLIWPWARAGNAQARAMLATGAYAAGLMPPGMPADALARLRHTLVLAAHGAQANDAANDELLRSLLKTELLANAGGRELAQCLVATPAAKECVTEAVKTGLVPSFEAYAKELDELKQRNKQAAASCNKAATEGLPPPAPPS